MVPDYRMTLTDPVEGVRCRLAELKSITCCSSQYIPGGRMKAVDRRANLLMTEYRKKAKDSDRQYVGVEEG